MSNNDWNIIEHKNVSKQDIKTILTEIKKIDEKIDKLSEEKNLNLLIKIESMEKELKLLKEKIESNSNVRSVNNIWRSQYSSLAPGIISLPNLSNNYLNNI